jgi:hypothetical protein
VDHYVAVLEVSDTEVIVGDPLKGKCKLTWPQFADRWRKSGILIRAETL